MRLRLDGLGALSPGQSVALPAEEAHHLIAVLRAREGDDVELIGPSGAWLAQLVSLEPPVAMIIEALEGGLEANPARSLELWLPLLKGGRSDDLVRQLTELGASRIVPFQSARTVAILEGAKAAKRVERWRRIAAEATKQCGRTDLPEIWEVASLAGARGPGVFFWEQASAKARAVLAGCAGQGAPLRVLVGPEGGLALDEAQQLEASGWRAAWLGPRILRAETAVIVAATLALSALGEGGY